MRYCAFVYMALVAMAALAADSDPYAAQYAKTLQQHGIEANPEGALKYLRQLRPSKNYQARVTALIAQLGSDDFTQRQSASRQLQQMANLPVTELNRAAQSNNFEIRWRSRRILSRAEDENSQILLAALKTVAQKPPAGATIEIVASLPLCTKNYLLAAAIEALKVAVGPNDMAMLRTGLRGKNHVERLAVAAVLASTLPKDKLAELYPLLDDSHDLVALRVAQTIADKGDRHSLATLVRLLESRDAIIRAQSARFLQSLSGKQLGFASHDVPEKRSQAIVAWKKWLDAEGATATLHYPVVVWQSGRGPLRGNTLISTGMSGRVVELDPEGKEVWSFDITAWSAEKLPNGNVLIGSYNNKRLIEVNADKEVVWEFSDLSAMSAKPLLGGNVLVADYAGHRVVEINRKKTIVWEYATPDECFDADRLPNGNTIFGCPNLIREVTPDGKTVREWKVQGRLNGFQPLPSGNILVANYGIGKVQEYSPEGRVVWELDEVGPCDVYRLPSGAMLVSTASRIVEIGPDKKVIHEIFKARYGSARR